MNEGGRCGEWELIDTELGDIKPAEGVCCARNKAAAEAAEGCSGGGAGEPRLVSALIVVPTLPLELSPPSLRVVAVECGVPASLMSTLRSVSVEPSRPSRGCAAGPR